MTKGRCIHCSHQGIKTLCAKGHDIDAFVKAATPPGEDWKLGSRLRAPCDSKEWDIELFTRGGGKLSEEQLRIIESKPTCPDFTDPTDEQIKQYDEEFDEVCDRMNKVHPVIAKFKKENKFPGGWTANKTKVACPCCGKTLAMTISGYNGHVWGRCETEGCVSWME